MKKNVCTLVLILFFSTLAPFFTSAAPISPEFKLSYEEKQYLDTIKDTPISLAITSELCSFVNIYGEKSGLLQPLITIMEDSWGLAVETVNLGWDESFRKLDSGEVDLLGLAISNEKRRSMYNYTEALYSANMDIYTNGKTPMGSILELKGKTIGLLTSSALSERLEVYLTSDSGVKYYQTVEELISAVESGEVFCIATALTIQSELLDHPDVNYEMSIESIVAPQCLYSKKERFAPLMNLIDRYLASPEGLSVAEAINTGRRKCVLEKYREFYKDDIDYIKENYDKLPVFDSGMMYPLSYAKNGQYFGLQNEINHIVYELTGVPMEMLGYSDFVENDGVVDALKRNEILAIAGIHRTNQYSRDASLEYSMPLVTDTLSFYVRQSNTESELSKMRIGSLDFGGSYVDWNNINSEYVKTYSSREDLINDLRGNKLDAVFIGEMTTDYYYTVLNDYTLKRFNNLTVPAGVHLLYNSGNKSFNRIMNTAVELQAVIDPESRTIWDKSSQNDKFESMWMKNQLNLYQQRTIKATIIFIGILIVFLLVVIYQLRKFRDFDRQISKMLSAQGNVDMLWGDLKTGKIISKGGYPISKELGFSNELTEELTKIDLFRESIEEIETEQPEYYVKDIEVNPEDSDIAYFLRYFIHKIDETRFMVYVVDFTAEKYRERELSELANTDYLTKLLNRRAMDNLLIGKDGFSSGGKRVFMFMLDIDNFKKVNDSYGHNVGDKVLTELARIAEAYLSKGKVARWGGEEFLGVAELESKEQAIELAQKILDDFEATEFTVNTNQAFYSTVSCGVAECEADETYADAVTRADMAMYQAKCDGKNCVRFIGSGGEAATSLLSRESGNAGVLVGSVTYNRVMSRLVQVCFTSRSVDYVILELLKTVSEYNGFDMAFLFEKTDEGVFTRTYLYDPEGLASADTVSSLTDEQIKSVKGVSFNASRFVSSAPDEMPEAELAAGVKGLQSYAQLPIVANGNLIGFVGFNNCHEAHEWSDDDRHILSDLTLILGEFVVRRNLERKLTRSNATMLTILDSNDDIIYVVEYKTKKLLFANEKARNAIGNISFRGKTCWEVFRPDLGGPCDFCMHKHLADETGKQENKSIRHEVYNKLADMWFDVTDTMIDWENGEKAVVMVCRDITADKNADISMQKMLEDMQMEKEREGLLLESLRSQEVKTNLALESANSFSWEYIPGLDKLIMSKAAEIALGFPPGSFDKSISKQDFYNGIAFDYAFIADRELNNYIDGLTDIYSAEYPIIMPDGELKWFFDRGRYSDEKRTVIYGVCIDVTDRKLYEQRLSERAYKDQMTSLFNKQYLTDGLIRPISDNFENFGGILLDVKSFKNINEAFGYGFGDKLIEKISIQLEEIFYGKIIVRISGNRFLAVFENTSMEMLEGCAKEVLNEFECPILIDGQTVRVNFKIGVAISLSPDVTNLLKDAEIALYSAKESQTGDYRVLSESARLSFSKKANIEFELVRAIEKNEFVMYYQPKVLTATKQAVGAEALIRWKHPELGIMPPLDFIPIAEETGLIIPIGEFVISETARQLSQWLNDGLDLFLSFNLSVKQFMSPSLKEHISSTMETYKIPRNRFVVEITESTMISDFEHVMQILNEFHALGIGVSLDDFGTGYSSMNYLGKIPLDYLKIDKSFIDNATTVSKDRSILEAIVSMSHKLGFKVTAEGVETADQVKMIEALGCDIIQGYYFSRPLLKEEFEEYVKLNTNKEH